MKYDVKLTDQTKQRLRDLVEELQQQISVLEAKVWKRPQDEFQGRKKERCAQRKLTHCRILVLAAQASSDPSVTDSTIARDLGVDPELVELVCKQFLERGLDGALKPILTTVEREFVDRWYREFGEKVVQEVRQSLRMLTKGILKKSDNSVAQSVWLSFQESHFDEIFDPSDPNCAWGLLARAAKRHCEKHNQRAKRYKEKVSLDALVSRPSDDGSPSRFDPPDTRDTGPVAAVLEKSCQKLLAVLSDDQQTDVARSIDAVSGAIELVERLTEYERKVLGLKLARKTRQEIASELKFDKGEVDDHWESIQRKAEHLEEVEDDDEEPGGILA